MTENEDKKIISLFEEYARKEIPDDGFSRRVMSELPSSDYVYKQCLNRIWAIVCTAAGIALFFFSDGFVSDVVQTSFICLLSFNFFIKS